MSGKMPELHLSVNIHWHTKPEQIVIGYALYLKEKVFLPEK